MKEKKIKKEFFFDEKSFIGELVEAFQSYKIWEKSDSGYNFITTALPSSDQLVVFEKPNKQFVFFNRFVDCGELWKVGSDDLVGHYVPLIPYQARALILPYEISCSSRGEKELIIEFFDSVQLSHSWKFQKKPCGLWYSANI